MKVIFKLLLLVSLVTVYACRDAKSDEATIKAVEEIENIEIETDSITDGLEKEAQDLQKELEELDIN